ncbi:MAG: hypothetical protein FD174_620 [Geobacteraceae bacterium]|nr:MAG: hypothetical protein FD174_620 [Geobacteraceae bacterium]
MMLKKVISGGQTGVDRAGLDAAMDAGIPVGGCCPKGRKSEDGTIPDIYPLQELSTTQYHIRTEKNVVESDGTLILNKGPLTQGTKATYEYTQQHHKAYLIVQLDAEQMIDPAQVVRWIEGQQIRVLNVAGPRESKFPEGIYREASLYLGKVFSMLKEDH